MTHQVRRVGLISRRRCFRVFGVLCFVLLLNISIRRQRLNGSGYVFSASLPPYLSTVAMVALKRIKEDTVNKYIYVNKLRKNTIIVNFIHFFKRNVVKLCMIALRLHIKYKNHTSCEREERREREIFLC